MHMVFSNMVFCVCPFPFGIDSGMWDVIVLISDNCLSIYSVYTCIKTVQKSCLIMVSMVVQ